MKQEDVIQRLIGHIEQMTSLISELETKKEWYEGKLENLKAKMQSKR